MMGVRSVQNTKLSSLWSQNPFQIPFFAGTMAQDRFQEILAFICFDKSTTREKRKKTDKLAPIREIHNLFTSNCKKNYLPGEHVTVDEMLIPFRGRVAFRVYMKSKPAKYGMKVWVLADSTTRYCWNLQAYTGKVGKKAEANQGQRVVLELIEGLPPGIGVVTDNYFTSLSLAKKLLAKKMTLLGTLRKNRVEVPKEVLANKFRSVYSSIFLEVDSISLVSYVPKKNKCVLLLSTEHNVAKCSNKEKKFKPEMILDYNATKGGIDSVDQMVNHFTSVRGT